MNREPKKRIRITIETSQRGQSFNRNSQKSSYKSSSLYCDIRKFFSSMRSFFEEKFPGYGGAIFYGLLGFSIAILITATGVFRLIMFAVLILIGIIIGRSYDGDSNILDTIRSWFERNF